MRGSGRYELQLAWLKNPRILLPDRIDPAWQIHQCIQLAEARMFLGRLAVFVDPGALLRNIGRPRPRLERREDVGAHGISSHHRAPGRDAIGREQAAERVGMLVADDLDAREMASQSRRGELGLLVEQIALGDQHQPATRGERLKRILDALEQYDGMGEQFLPRLQE